jgi:hypothetical protein
MQAELFAKPACFVQTTFLRGVRVRNFVEECRTLEDSQEVE